MTVHFFLLLTIVLFFFGSWSFFPGPDLTHSYPAHFFTFISTAPTLVPYLLSPTDTTTLITSYLIDLAIVLITYPTNLATLLITYPTLNVIPAFWAISKVRMWGLSIFIRRSYPKCNTCISGHTTNQATILTTYLTNLATLLITYPINLTIRFRVETHKLIDKFFINV
jgi:hypothetical protein